MPVNDRIQLRRGTEDQWIAAEAADVDDEPLADGEPGVVVDADGVPLYLVVGDTGTEFEDLPRFSPDSALSGAFAPLAAGIEGSGVPNGVVAAPAGTVYRDLAATNGAVVWVKAAGTGSSGWRVMWGDTGWRAITTWDASGNITGESLTASWAPASGVAGGIYVRRVGDMVTVQANFLERIGANDVNVWASFALPTGLRPAHSMVTPVILGTSSVGSLSIGSNGALGRGTASAAGADGIIRQHAITYPAHGNAPWPTTLPGTAA